MCSTHGDGTGGPWPVFHHDLENDCDMLALYNDFLKEKYPSSDVRRITQLFSNYLPLYYKESLTGKLSKLNSFVKGKFSN